MRLKAATSPRKALVMPPAPQPSPAITAPLPPPPSRRARSRQLAATRLPRSAPPAVPVLPPWEPPRPAPPPTPPVDDEAEEEAEEGAAQPEPEPHPDPVQANIDRYAMFEPGAQPVTITPPPAPSRVRLTPRKVRLVVAAAVVVACLAAVVLWMGSSDTNDRSANRPLPAGVEPEPRGSSSSTTTTAAGAPAVTPAQWITFADPGGRFTVELPNEPTREDDELPSSVGPVAADLFTSDIGGEVAVVVGVLELADDAIVDLQAVAAGLATSTGLDIGAAVPSVDAAGRAQLDVQLSSVTGTKFLARFLDASDGRVYALMAGSPTEFPDTTFNRLVSSFKPA